ncbi:MAG: ABC transporter permease subunit [Desulfatitalea sp.]|nr:ABC transporter permease subunit [Desulfatitalea sp.]
MRQALLIFNKEFKDYFVSPIAYIVIAIFLAFAGWLFFSTFFLYDQAELRRFFDMLPFLLALLVPIITMRLFAEELNVGSYELLLTLPVTSRDIIVGKFLAAVAFVAALLLPTLLYAVCIGWIGDLDWGVVIGGYIGALLLGAAYAAIGLFTSALTRNQIIACIAAIVICVALAIVDQMLFFFPPLVLDVVTHLSANAHFGNIAKGIVDSRDLLYFLSIAFLGLYATHLAMEDR